jgi:hypothetical protein
MFIPRRGFHFKRVIGGVTLSSQIGFEDIKVLNLMSTLRRKGEAVLTSEVNGPARLPLHFSVGPLTVTATSVLRVMGLGSKRTFRGSIDHIEVEAAVEYNHRKDSIELEHLRIAQLSPIVVMDASSGALSILNTASIMTVLSTFQRSLKLTLELAINQALTKQIPEWHGLKNIMRTRVDATTPEVTTDDWWQATESPRNSAELPKEPSVAEEPNDHHDYDEDQ